jgi:hypothetical protein
MKSEEEAEDDLALGETPLDDGFRRVGRGPAPLELARLRELLLEVASDGAALTRAGLEGFGTWRSVATLCGTEWARGSRRGSAAALRLLRRRLQWLGTRASSIAEASALPVGSPVHLVGTVRPLPQSRATSHIWSYRAMTSHNLRLDLEEGHDFFLVAEDGRTARVISRRGHLVNAERLDAGDRVSVFGATDLVAGSSETSSLAADRDARRFAVRAGDDAPLVVRREPQAD